MLNFKDFITEGLTDKMTPISNDELDVLLNDMDFNGILDIQEGTLIPILKKNIDRSVVFHYNCPECNHEQVTHEVEIDEELINDFENDIKLEYDCIDCSVISYVDDIFAIEFMD